MAPSATLPAELINLLALHSSFLTALSLHYAHRGTATPADLRTLTQSITAVWQKRKVTVDDVRLCVGVLAAGPQGAKNPFYLSDYGVGKICLEIREELWAEVKMGALNEEALQAMFMESLDHLWKLWTQSQSPAQKIAARPIAPVKRGRGRPKKNAAVPQNQKSMEAFVVDDASVSKFLAQLPHAEITICSSAAAIAPLRETGRKRLREFKDSVQASRTVKKVRETTGKEKDMLSVLAQEQQQQQPAPAKQQAQITQFASVRKTNLLDRILAKQAAASAIPTQSPAELQRKSALQRSEEVLGVISLLAANKNPGARVSFSLAALLQSLQNSIRSPLSKDEVLKCVEVLAQEVCPGYVSVLRMGSMESVVINQGMRPVDVRGRVAALGAF